MLINELNSEISALEEEIIELTNRIDEFGSYMEELQEDCSSYDDDIKELNKFIDTQTRNTNLLFERTKDAPKRAYLSVFEIGYDVAETKVGNLILAINSIEPYLDGYKVDINIGNPNNATFNGLELDVICIAKDRVGDPETHLISVTDTISAGSWNSVEFMIPGLSFDNLGYLNIQATSDLVSLY